jgi:predicted Zn-dependent peptidase
MGDLDRAFERGTLENGLPWIYVKRPGGLVRLEVMHRNGHAAEDRNQIEYAHFSEHLVAQFTSPAHPRYEENRRLLGSLGANSNAWTGSYATGYWIEGPSDRAEDVLVYAELLSGAMLDYTYDDSVDFRNQQEIVVRELASRKDSRWTPLYLKVARTLHPGHRFSVSHDERIASVRRSRVDDVVAYRNDTMTPEASVLVISGDVSKQLLRRVLSAFSAEAATSGTPVTFPPVRAFREGPLVLTAHVPGTRSSRVIFHWQTELLEWDTPEWAAASAVADLMGGDEYSRLFRVLREDKGLIYSVSSDVSPVPTDPTASSYVIAMDTDAKRKTVSAVIKHVLEEVERMRKRSVGDDELRRFHRGVVSQRARESFNVELGKWGEVYGRHILWGREPPRDALRRRWDALLNVSAADIKAAALKIMDPTRLIIAVGGPRE